MALTYGVRITDFSTNPFTGEEMMFKAKPARKIVRARPVKAAKDAV